MELASHREVRMKLGYARVSTKDQNEARQIDALIEDGVEIRNIYVDKCSGKDFNRESYKILLKAMRSGDILVIKSLDRLGRNYDEIRNQFKYITDNNVSIHVLDTPVLNTDSVISGGITVKFVSDLILSVLSFVADQERVNIRSRQSEGILAAKRRGKKFGRPKKRPADFDSFSKSVAMGNITVIQACELMKISRKSYYNYLQK